MKSSNKEDYLDKIRNFVSIYINIYEKLLSNKKLTDIDYDFLYCLDTYFVIENYKERKEKEKNDNNV